MYTNLSVALQGLQPPEDSSSSNFSIQQIFTRCFNFTKISYIITAFSATNILFILPLYILIIYLGFQRWKRCPASTTSQSDIFTYNSVALGLIEIFASTLFPAGAYLNMSELMNLGVSLFYISWSVNLQFHALICIECYLAVVHPLVYLGLKNKNGRRIRNILIFCNWLVFLSWLASSQFVSDEVKLGIFLWSLAFAFIVICFCNVVVLWVLKRPGPGHVSSDEERVDPTKRRAFITILIIMGAVLLTLLWVLVCNALFVSPLLDIKNKCEMIAIVTWISLPCSLVLPLLYLHRAGKLPCCTQSPDGG